MLLKLPLIFIVSFIVVSLLQLVASIDGIMYFFGIHWFLAIIAAAALLFIPGVGPLAGVYGAVKVWGWPIWGALVLFFWPYILYGLMLSLGMTTSFFMWKRMFAPFERNHPATDIEPDYEVREDDDGEKRRITFRIDDK
ncbi:MAG: hypothetical protein ACI4PW_08645 [Alphaproteobacteria bacterium]|jgi:fatty acid desaturase